MLAVEGIQILLSPPQAPRANTFCERLIGTLRRELLDRLLIINEHHLREVMTEYLQHYNTARPHRTLAQLPPAQEGTPPLQIDLASTGFAENKSSTALAATTRPSHDHPAITRKRSSLARRIFEPHRITVGCGANRRTQASRARAEILPRQDEPGQGASGRLSCSELRGGE